MDNCLKILEELKSKELIPKDTQLVSSKFTPNFKASIRKNKIIYNQSISGYCNNSIRFILLHEMGHQQRNRLFGYIAVFLSAVISFLIYFLISYLLRIGRVVGLLVLITSFFISFRLFIPKLRRGEFDADEWAAVKILKGYPSTKPSMMIIQAFTDLKHKPPKKDLLYQILRYVYKLIKYHPSDEERIDKIRRLEYKQPTQ